MEKKKLKLSVSGASKKTINSIEQAKSHSKNTVVIEKRSPRFGGKQNFSRVARSAENKPQSTFAPKKTKAQNPGKKGFTLNEQPFSRALTIAVAIMKQFICTQ